MTLQYDNQQTIRVVNADIALLPTKLRHIDIHNRWLRREAVAPRIRVVYTTYFNRQLDRRRLWLTMVLTVTAHKHVPFTKQLEIGLVDIKGEMDRRRRVEE